MNNARNWLTNHYLQFGEEHVVPASTTQPLAPGHVKVLKSPVRDSSERVAEMATMTIRPRRQSLHDIPVEKADDARQFFASNIRLRKGSVDSTHAGAPYNPLSSSPAHRRPSVPYVSINVEKLITLRIDLHRLLTFFCWSVQVCLHFPPNMHLCAAQIFHSFTDAW